MSNLIGQSGKGISEEIREEAFITVEVFVTKSMGLLSFQVIFHLLPGLDVATFKSPPALPPMASTPLRASGLDFPTAHQLPLPGFPEKSLLDPLVMPLHSVPSNQGSL